MVDVTLRGADIDRLAIVELQADRGAQLWAFARHLGLEAEEADDAVQESLLRAWVALSGHEPIAALDAWTFKTLYRLCMDQHRLRRRVQGLIDRMAGNRATRSAVDETDRIVLWDAVDSLPPRQRAVLYLRYQADLPFDQIASVLGIAAVSARSHASRGIEALRRRLGEPVEGES
jgi:RNA polymerase sigma factor (sigma-70 family)